MTNSRLNDLTVDALRDNELAQAYTLVGLCHDGVSLEDWRDHVAAAGQPDHVVWSTVRDRRGYMHALYCHRVEHDLVAGRTLHVGDILTAGPGWRAALAEILHDLGRRATALGCAAIRVNLRPDGKAPSTDQLRGVFVPGGFVERGGYLLRTFEPGNG